LKQNTALIDMHKMHYLIRSERKLEILIFLCCLQLEIYGVQCGSVFVIAVCCSQWMAVTIWNRNEGLFIISGPGVANCNALVIV
jgi:hypothetical protein